MKKNLTTVLLTLMLLSGVGLLLYPTLAHTYNMIYATHAIDAYENALTELTPEDYDSYFQAADDYNARLRQLPSPLSDYEDVPGYEDMLSIGGSNLIGYIRIEKIHVNLPIFHGTSSSVLAEGVGHMEGTSLPVGGESTHAVLSAHRGLPQARLFTDLDKLEEGDLFTITVLDRVLTYQVDKITITEPTEVNHLLAEDGEDAATLLTCTPYAVNTHRLLVHGKRVENVEKVQQLHVTSDAIQIEPLLCAPFYAIPIVIALFALAAIFDRRKSQEEQGG